MKLDDLMKFTEVLNTFRRVERVLYVPGTDRLENDVEHSYHLAMLAWFILTAEKTDLDLDLVIRYALIHDLVEAYAGDTYTYSTDKQHLESKKEREHAALKRLQGEFPLHADMFRAIESYERRDDRESRFVYALDKIQPVIHINLDNGRMYREKGVTIEMLYEEKKDKVALSPEIVPYFDELMAFLKEKEKELF